MKKIIILLSMGAGLIDDYIRNILAIPFCPYHFVHTILSNTILSVYHFVRILFLSVPFCTLPFCPRTVSRDRCVFHVYGVWTSTRGRGSGSCGRMWTRRRRGQTPDFLVDVING